eukprot:8916979-Lingulodinium_polyedra.AAC.1
MPLNASQCLSMPLNASQCLAMPLVALPRLWGLFGVGRLVCSVFGARSKAVQWPFIAHEF